MTAPRQDLPRAELRIICADDHADIVSMVRFMVDREADMRCVFTCADAQGVLDYLADGFDVAAGPTVVLLDYTMPGLAPLDAVKQIAVRWPAVQVLVFTGHDESEVQAAAADAGAVGVVGKYRDLSEIVAAIRRAGRTGSSVGVVMPAAAKKA